MKVPVLMLTYNRLEYTKRSLAALIACENVLPFVIDNGSTDGTEEYLNTEVKNDAVTLFNRENKGIAYAMNQFLKLTRGHKFVGKVDNDTIVEKDWCLKMLPYLEHADIIQSKHHIIPATCEGGWDEFVKDMQFENGLYFNNYVGGSGILFNRRKISTMRVPETEWKLGGWRKFQGLHKELTKAFVADVDIKLLDEHGYQDYPEYYKETGRTK